MIDLRIRVFVLILAAALLAFGAGCGSSDDAAAPSDSAADVADTGDAAAANATPSLPGVTTRIAKEGESVELPTGYPTDFPLYPGARPTMAQDASASASVAFETKDSGPEVYSYFSEHLTNEGWTIKNNTDLGGKYMITAEKDGKEVSVFIPPSKDGLTSILLLSKS